MALSIAKKFRMAHLFLFALLISWQPAAAFDLFYISIGNSEYRDASLDIPDANLSARQVAHALRRAGAVDGLTLVSERGAYITPEDVKSAVEDVIKRASHADRPLIIYYFIGHGRSDGGTMHHVSVTGSHKHKESEEALIATRSLREAFSQSRIPFILLMDNCFWRQSLNAFIPMGMGGLPVLSSEVASTVRSGAEEGAFSAATLLGTRLLDAVSGSAGASDPLPYIEIYAAEEQETTRTLPHPMSPRYAIGPLARRMLLLLEEAFESREAIDVPSFLARMQDKSFDPVSVAGHVIQTTSSDAPVLFQAGGATDVDGIGDMRRGTDG